MLENYLIACGIVIFIIGFLILLGRTCFENWANLTNKIVCCTFIMFIILILYSALIALLKKPDPYDNHTPTTKIEKVHHE